MKRMLAGLLVCLLLCSALPAFAGTQEMLLITELNYAPLYDSYDLSQREIIAYIPEGEVALCLAAVDWGYCVAFGNYVGYIDEDAALFVDSDLYDWNLPTGRDYLYEPPCGPDDSPVYNGGNESADTSYVPEFPYAPIYTETNQKLATRSGPNTKYTEPGSFNEAVVGVYYQTPGNGVQWACVEFEEDGLLYRVYTGMKRIDPDRNIPHDAEDYLWCVLLEEHEPRLGPGWEYAPSGVTVPAGTLVRAYYQQYGWLMFEYDLPDGDVLRAWAPAGSWL